MNTEIKAALLLLKTTSNTRMRIRAANILETYIEELEETLYQAKDIIKAWHNIDKMGLLTKEQAERIWELYQGSPEMKRINDVLKKV